MPSHEESEVRAQIEALAHAIRAKNVAQVLTHYAENVVTFDVMPPLQVRGAPAYQKNFEAWFGAMRGPMSFEVVELAVAAEQSLAVCHYLAHVTGTWEESGEPADYWVRATSSFRKHGGRWSIVHEHVSVPQNPPARS